jgi:SAM-dependent methyltransferase
MKTDTAQESNSAYNRLFAAYYDRITTHKDYRAESTALLRHIERSVGKGKASILDVGCGTGTHANLLADAGNDVLGVDLACDMIEIAKAKRGGAEFLCSDVALVQRSDFSFATSLFNVVNCLPDLPALRRLAKAIHDRLRTDGGVLVEAWNPIAVIAKPPAIVERVFGTDTERIVRTVTPLPDFLNQRLDLRYDIVVETAAGRNEFSVLHQLVLFTPLEIMDCLEGVGFREVEVLTALPDLAAPDDASRMLAFTARK